MTNKTIATAAKTTIAYALASALVLGTCAVPVLAATTGAPDGLVEVQMASRPAGCMSEGEAVFIARTHLGIAPEDVFDLDCDLEMYRGGLCWDVEIETYGSTIEHHVLLDAHDGTVYAAWDE